MVGPVLRMLGRQQVTLHGHGTISKDPPLEQRQFHVLLKKHSGAAICWNRQSGVRRVHQPAPNALEAFGEVAIQHVDHRGIDNLVGGALGDRIAGEILGQGWRCSARNDARNCLPTGNGRNSDW